MTLQEATNVAWHIRVNGFDGVSQEHIKDAMLVLEKLAEAASNTLDQFERLQAVVGGKK